MSDLNDIVAVGLDLSPKTLLNAYAQGAFPWPTEDLPLLWYSPLRRGVLEFKDLHYSKRLKQYLKSRPWKFSVDHAFPEVIQACSERGEEGTWITPEMKLAYLDLHQLGHAHSIEVWNGEKLVGGLYGVDTAGYFAGESMFHLEDNASKAALLFTISLLKKSGRTWMDTQVITPHMAALGAKEIPRAEFKKKLSLAKGHALLTQQPAPFLDEGLKVYGDFSILIE